MFAWVHWGSLRVVVFILVRVDSLGRAYGSFGSFGFT